MLDLNLIRETPDLVRTALKNRQLDASPVEEDRARATLARITADMCAGQSELFAKEVDEKGTGLDVRLAHPSVDGERQLGHRLLSVGKRVA